jgi:hypothetical protein
MKVTIIPLIPSIKPARRDNQKLGWPVMPKSSQDIPCHCKISQRGKGTMRYKEARSVSFCLRVRGKKGFSCNHHTRGIARGNQVITHRRKKLATTVI